MCPGIDGRPDHDVPRLSRTVNRARLRFTHSPNEDKLIFYVIAGKSCGWMSQSVSGTENRIRVVCAYLG